MVVRSYKGPFLKAAKSYLQRLADDLGPLQVNNGGPILMIQVENEYGSFGQDHSYTTALRDILHASFDGPVGTVHE